LGARERTKMSLRREHLRIARLRLGMTALDLAEAAGNLTEPKVYNVERGRCAPTRDEALSWAAALAMPPKTAFPEVFTSEKGGRHERPH